MDLISGLRGRTDMTTVLTTHHLDEAEGSATVSLSCTKARSWLWTGLPACSPASAPCSPSPCSCTAGRDTRHRIPTQEEYVGLTPVVAILPWFLAGSLFPITALPAWLAWVARVLPTTHVLALLRYGAVPSVGLASGLTRATTVSTSATVATPPLWQRHRQRRSPISQTAGRPTTGPSRHAAATQPTRAAPRPLSPRDGRPRRDIHGWTLLAVQFVR